MKKAYHYFAAPYGDRFTAEFRPINPNTGKPWQASHRIPNPATAKPEKGANPTRQEWLDRWTYPTEESAKAAIEHHKAN